jgi:hypothetical protein
MCTTGGSGSAPLRCSKTMSTALQNLQRAHKMGWAVKALFYKTQCGFEARSHCAAWEAVI